jgi:hypothetical protein
MTTPTGLQFYATPPSWPQRREVTLLGADLTAGIALHRITYREEAFLHWVKDPATGNELQVSFDGASVDRFVVRVRTEAGDWATQAVYADQLAGAFHFEREQAALLEAARVRTLDDLVDAEDADVLVKLFESIGDFPPVTRLAIERLDRRDAETLALYASSLIGAGIKHTESEVTADQSGALGRLLILQEQASLEHEVDDEPAAEGEG